MAKIWIRAKTILHVEVDGILQQIHPGDWVKVGKHQARQWLATNQCDIPKIGILKAVQNLDDCAVSLRGNGRAVIRQDLERRYPGLEIDVVGIELADSRNLLWDTTVGLRAELILVGFGLLCKGWQVAVPLVDYDLLAENIEPEEHEKTKAVIHDLRVPVYETGVIFARRCPQTRRLLETWQAEGGGKLAFLRALHLVRPVVLALPSSWVNR